MRFSKFGVAILFSASLIAIPGLNQPAMAGKTRDAIAAGLIGAAIVAAASRHHKHRQQLYYDDYEPYPPEEYNTRFSNSYSPSAGITCYYVQNACYKANGHFSARWTRNQFAGGAQ